MATAGKPNGKDGAELSLDAEEFSSDFFRIFLFKVKRCPRGRPHDWTQCPFAHPGEKAKRRDPRRYQYSGTACPDFRKNGCCRRGDACLFAHGVFECWLHPARYRTQSCADGTACNRRVCFFAHVESELRKPDDNPAIQNGAQSDLAADNQISQQQLANALGALLGNGVASLGPQTGTRTAADGGDSRPLANQLAERAQQLEQQLQALQALQAQHVAGTQSFEADAARVAMARRALAQQQLQDQVDRELLPLMGGPRLGALSAAMGMQRQGSMEGNSLLQRRHSQELHGSVPGLMAGPDMLPHGGLAGNMNQVHSFRGPQMAGITADGFAAGYFSAGQQLDRALPMSESGEELYRNGHHPFIMDRSGAAVHARHCHEMQATASMRRRSSWEMQGAGPSEMLLGGGRMGSASGRASLDLVQQNGRGSMDMPPLKQRSSFDAASARAAACNVYGASNRRRPARHSVDLGAVQRQAVIPHGGLFAPGLNGIYGARSGSSASLERSGSETHCGNSSPSQHGSNSPGLQGLSHAFGGLNLAHLQGVPMSGSAASSRNNDAGRPVYGSTQSSALQEEGRPASGLQLQATHGLSAGEQRAHTCGHSGSHHLQRLETVGEGEVSRLYANGGAQTYQLTDFGSTKLQGPPNRDTFSPATDSTGYRMARNASFDRILAELPRSLSEVALPGGISLASMDGPVRLDS